VNGTVPRLALAIVCLTGIVLGGALAPAVGVQTPVPDLGVENSTEESVGEELLVDSEPASETSADADQPPGSGGESGEAAAGEFVDDVETDDGTEWTEDMMTAE
jgi:hypothetical protein